MCAVKGALVFFYTLDFVVGNKVLVAASCGSGAIILSAYIKYLPFYNLSVNRFHVAAALTFCWACFCMCLLEIRGTPKVTQLPSV
jgi:hypothetical protein